MRIATYNLNGIRSRLDILLRWLKEDKPDVVCLQELKSVNFPFGEIERAGYGAVWYGQKAWNGVAILARGQEPLLTRKGLPGDPQGSHSGHIEAAIDGVLIGCMYLPNGNPAPGPKLDYKLAWIRQLQEYADELLEFDIPVVLAGDYNVAPSDLDVYKPERWIDDALLRPEIRQAYASLVGRGWTDAVRHLHPDERVYTFWTYWRNSFERDAGLRIDHLFLSPAASPWLRSAFVRRKARGCEHTSDHAPIVIELEVPKIGDER